MARIAASSGLSETEIHKFEEILQNPTKHFGMYKNPAALENETDLKKSYQGQEIKEGLNAVPRKTFSTQNHSLQYNALYEQYYNELTEIYEGHTFKNPTFEAYIIETFLRRKEK